MAPIEGRGRNIGGWHLLDFAGFGIGGSLYFAAVGPMIAGKLWAGVVITGGESFDRLSVCSRRESSETQ